MDDYERLAAENARLKRILSNQGFKITYTKSGMIARVSAPRKAPVKHTAITWAAKRGYKGSMSLVRKITKDKAVGERKFKNSVERAELIREAQKYLKQDGYNIPYKFFEKIPTYALKNNAFYENVNNIFNYTNESEATELNDVTIRQSMKLSVERIKKMNQQVVGSTKTQTAQAKKKLKPKLKLR